MQIIMLIGKQDCGKTTTCRLLHKKLFKWSGNRKTNYKEHGGDFSTTLNFNYKNVAIKSAGDSRHRVQSAIDKYTRENFDFLICTCRPAFSDMIEYARQISNGDLIKIYKEKMDTEDKTCAQNKNDVDHIISILKS